MAEQETHRHSRTLDSNTVHTLSNHLGVILGFVDLVLEETPEDDARRGDLLEIKQAAAAAAALLDPGSQSK
jgi:hypothetical protein